MALFITFEGGEGSGKTVHTRALYRRLLRNNIPAVLTHEPGGTLLGEKISRWLKWSKEEEKISPMTELLLFNASRVQLINELILPSLKKDLVVICDRYTDSTVTYQSYARGLPQNTVEQVNRTATGGLKPDLTFLLDVPVEVGFTRKSNRKNDRFEKEDVAFHQKVREGFLALAAKEPRRWVVIDATLPRAEVREIIWKKVNQRLTNGKK